MVGDAREDLWPFGPVGTASDPASADPASADPATAGPPTGTAPIRRARIRRTPTERDEVVIELDVRRVQIVLWAVVGSLIALDVLVSAGSGLGVLPYTITRFFDGDDKVNFPTGAKTTMLLAATVLMLGCWTAGRRRNDPAARGWLLLSLVTAFAFVDETTFLHQSLSGVLSDKFHFHGLLKYSWTIVYAPAAILVGVFLLRNLRLMRPAVRNRLLPGGAVYVAGAMLFEPIKSKVADSQGDDSLPFKLVAALSDSLELAGLAVLVIGLLIAAGLITAGFSFAFSSAGLPPTDPAAGGGAGHPDGAPATPAIGPAPVVTRIVELPD